VHGWSVVHAVAEKADDVSLLLHRQDDSLFLVGTDLDEQIRAFGRGRIRVPVAAASSWV